MTPNPSWQARLWLALILIMAIGFVACSGETPEDIAEGARTY